LNDIQNSENKLKSNFNQMSSVASQKKTTLEGDLKKQLDINDNLCKQYFQKVQEFTSWMDSQKKILFGNSTHSLEDQLQNCQKMQGNISNGNTFNHAIEEAQNAVNARSILNNPYTALTVGDCKSSLKQWENMLQKSVELVLSQIEDKKKQGLTEEQLKEIKDNFAYFDKDKTNFLEKKELRPLLQSLGEDATPKAIDQILKTYDADGDGKLKFEEFMNLMKKNLGDADSEDEIKTSFKFLSYDRDEITLVEMTNVINDLSWKDRHVEYLKKEMKPKNNGYDFLTWTKEAFAR